MAKRKEVLLVQDVLKLGNMGDVVRVSPGFARNYLFPYGMAIPVGVAHKRQIDVLREKAAASEKEREVKALGLKKSLDGMSLQIAGRVSHEDQLFGSIGAREIVAALAKSGITIDAKQVHLHDKLKRLGVFNVEVRLHKSVPVTIKVEIVNSDPNAPTLSEQLAAAVAEKAEKSAEKAAEKDAKPADKADKADGKSTDKGNDKAGKKSADAAGKSAAPSAKKKAKA